MNQRFPIILLACLVISTTSLPLKVCKSRPKSGKNTGHVNGVKKVDQPNVFAKIREVNKGLTNGKLQIIHGDILKKEGRNAMDCESCLWPKSADGTVHVPYTLDSSYNADQLNLFLSSMQEYESLTCVRFVPRTTELSYLKIVSGNGCASNIGQVGGAQSVQLEAYGCMFRGIIQHELNHALEFYHENSRADRNKYINVINVTINDQNITQASIMPSPFYPYLTQMCPLGKDGLSVLDVAKINKLYNCDVCSELLNTPSGSFSSANYPSNYPNNLNCVWLIRIPYGQVSLTFKDFTIQNSFACTSDYIRIYDGPSRSSPMILNRLCGSLQLPTIVGSNNHMLIEFVSGSIPTSAGFSASYNTEACGGTFFAARADFTSPGYSSGSYQPNLYCTFMIYAPTGYRISLNGTYDIEVTSLCNGDRLDVYSSGAMVSPRYTFCGQGNISIKSVSNKMLLIFRTDCTIQKRGFAVTYSIFI